MTFPFFFQPIWKDSVPIFDGGIYDNFPVGPMKEAFHPDFIFGSTVAGGNKKVILCERGIRTFETSMRNTSLKR